MPKVTEAYKLEKRNMIVQTAWEILEHKPLYEMSMLEVVKKAGLSKGGIYLYFSDIDELLIETINTILESYKQLTFSADLQKDDVEGGLIGIFRQLGEYIESCPSIIGKIRFELSVYLNNHPQKIDTFLPRIKLQQTGTEFVTLVSEFIQKGVGQNRFRKDLEMDVLITNIMVYVDGMSDFVTRTKVYHGPKLKYSVSTYFEQYIQSQIREWLY